MQKENPLFIITHHKTPFSWGPREEASFEILKAAVSSDSLLIYLDFTATFHIFTDACKDAVSAVLCQEADSIFKPFEFILKKFLLAEYNYCIYNKEMLAVIKSLEKFRYYVLVYPLVVHTDNMAVKFILNKKTLAGGG